jgi:hypothetical protein
MFRRLTTRARVGLAALVAVFIAAAGLLAANVANASGPVLSTTERGLCIKQGTGEPRSLWLVAATHKCPDPYWGPASLKDAFGIEIPKSVGVIKQTAVKLDATHATATVVVSGLPAYVKGGPEVSGSVQGVAPAGVTVKFTAVAPTPGQTTRSFTASVVGPNLTGDQTATASVWVLTAELPAS